MFIEEANSNLSFDWRSHNSNNLSQYDSESLDPHGFFERLSYSQLANEM